MDQEKLKVAMASLAQSAGKDESKRSAFAEVIVEDIQPNQLNYAIFNAFMPTRSLNPGDSLVRKVRPRGWPVRTMVPGINHLADVPQLPRGGEVLYNIDYLITKLRMSVWEIRRGELGTLENFRNEMQNSVIDTVIARVFSLISSVWDGTKSGTNYTDATSTGLTKTIIEGMIDTVTNRSGSGDVRAIVGTKQALRPLYEIAGVHEHIYRTGTNVGDATAFKIDTILEEWYRTGRVTTYRGTPLIEVPQIYSRAAGEYDKPLLPTDKVMVIGDNAGEIITYGGIETQEYTDWTLEPPDYVFSMWQGYGMIIDRPENIGIIKVNGDPVSPYAIA